MSSSINCSGAEWATVPTVMFVVLRPLTSSRFRAIPKSVSSTRYSCSIIDMGEHDVGGLDVAVQQAALVGVVEGLGDRRAEDEPAGALGQGPRRLLDPAGRRAKQPGESPGAGQNQSRSEPPNRKLSFCGLSPLTRTHLPFQTPSPTCLSLQRSQCAGGSITPSVDKS